ncbi:hypothetical protein EGW08_015217 [Elysia chlorotica]|uniref:Sodium-coupled monocarboxylate transporter 1 n=1 Tax=Elysia chlorotica TaxID=188477 RepID=A0A433T668_ELYCH|nr:hypothetical protein EGW08_015217 [Elysia chlorotica]
MSESVTYGVADYAVGTVILLVPLAIGVWYAVRDFHKATRDEYLLGGRQMLILPVTMSTFISFTSAVSLMGTPAEIFYFGGIGFDMYLGLALSYVVGAFTVVPLMQPLKLTSVYEYLQLRYQSTTLHLLGTLMGMLQMIFYQAFVMLLPALALQSCANLPLWISLALFGGVGTIYTTIGGYKSVVWTDVFQTLVVLAGLFIIIIKGKRCIEVGGFHQVWSISSEGGRLDFNKFSPDPRTRHTHWSLILGFAVLWICNSLSQAVVQRISSLRSLKDAKKSFLLNAPFILLIGILNSFVGLIAYAYYFYKRCGPFEAGLITNRNQIAPYFVLHAMADLPGLSGLFLGVLCCGSLSTLSSGINAMAANTVQDFLSRPLRRVREATITFVTKVFALLYGALAILMSFFMAEYMTGPATQMTSAMMSALGSPVMGIIVMGASVPWANKYGALVGALVSLVVNLWMGMGSVIHAKPPTPLGPVPTDKCPVSNSSGFQTHASLTLDTQLNHYTNFLNADYEMFATTTTMSSNHLNRTTTSDMFFLYEISYEWYPVVGGLVCIITGLVVSFLTSLSKNDKGLCFFHPGSTEAKYIFPFLRRFWALRDDLMDSDLDEDELSKSEMTKLESRRKVDMTKDTLNMENVYPLLKYPRAY